MHENLDPTTLTCLHDVADGNSFEAREEADVMKVIAGDDG
jgi:hypothetical protein